MISGWIIPEYVVDDDDTSADTLLTALLLLVVVLSYKSCIISNTSCARRGLSAAIFDRSMLNDCTDNGSFII